MDRYSNATAIMNTRTRHSNRKPSEYRSFDSTVIYYRIVDTYGRPRNIVAAQTSGLIAADKAEEMVGTTDRLINDTGMGYREIGSGKIVAVETADYLVGDKPHTAVGFWVFK